jgi:hypothetical protein
MVTLLYLPSSPFLLHLSRNPASLSQRWWEVLLEGMIVAVVGIVVVVGRQEARIRFAYN